MTSQLILDQSFTRNVLQFLMSPSSIHLGELIENPTAQSVHAHATRYRNTTKNLKDFWQDILFHEKQRGSTHRQNIKTTLEYFDQHRKAFETAFTEVQEYLPAGIPSEFPLHTMVGYDIGIVFNGHAFLNLANPLFHEDPRELIYFAMHELHHVGYTSFQPLYTLGDLQTTSHLLDAIYYSTHLEGMAVYTPLHRRLQENILYHKDYSVLLDTKRRETHVHEYFNLLKPLMQECPRPLAQNDFEILEVMSGNPKRLWYITGAHMAQTIDSFFGRKKLVQTIIEGPTSFFNLYEAVNG